MKKVLLLVLALGFLAAKNVLALEVNSSVLAALKQGGHIVLFRHANAPGTGDPTQVVIGDCSTQRNLDAVGRAQSVKLGERFRSASVAVGEVWSSQWCRTRDTASLAFGAAKVKDQVAFNSFFGDASTAPTQTAAARRMLLQWHTDNKTKDNLVVVTHQVNITELTTVYPSSGEGVVLKREGNALRVVGRISPN
jgi:phosphohistidine phosphatase SixA